MSIFHNDNKTAGFRLKYFEVYNWGTFDKEIWSVSPDMQNSLLTGKNGSGKTTLIHGLLTLLVPRPSFFYNKTSDQTNSKERDEKSYFHGAFGRVKDEGKSASTIKEIRPGNKHYSVILAHFSNNEINLTLVQVRYFSNNSMRKEYIISTDELNINEHFKNLDPKGKWKKSLKFLVNLELFGDNFSKYSKRFSSIFGLKSEKALTLFAKTIGAKVLGNLNDFIRNNMLDKTNAEDEFLDLLENYNTLLATFRNIEKAEQQQNLLEPIIKKYSEYNNNKKQKEEIEEIKETIPAYFSKEKKALLKSEIENQQGQLDKINRELENIKLPELRDKHLELETSKANNKVTEQIKALEKDIKTKTTELNRRKKQANKYNRFAKKINFSHNLSENDSDIFYNSLKETSEKLTINQELQQENKIKWSDTRSKLIDAKKEHEEKSEEVKYLRDTGNKIAGRTAQIRDEIALSLNIKTSELPFVGELLQVKKNQKDWESAIERLLHSFALKILIKPEYYEKTNKYVNENKLFGKITYIKLEQDLFMRSETQKNSLYYKLEIKPNIGNEYTEYIDSQLKNRYDYLCTQDDKAFERHNKSLMLLGLFKNKNYHEKDDRQKVLNKQFYILGWDNKAKIKAIESELKKIDNQIIDFEKEKKKIEKEKEKLEQENENLINFKNFDDFQQLNWQETQIEIQNLEEDKENLSESSDQLKELIRQIEEIKKQIEEKEKHEKLLNIQVGGYEKTIETLKISEKTNNNILEKYNHVKIEKYFTELKQYITINDYTLDNIDSSQENTQKAVNKISGNITLKLNENKSKIEKDMRIFINPDDEIKKKFPTWNAEIINLKDEISYYKEFEKILTVIKNDNLPSLKERFRKKLKKDIINQITTFKAELEKTETQIKTKIDELNDHSLKQINYSENPKTYITIKYDKDDIDKAIKNFQFDLKGIMQAYAMEYKSEEQTFKNTFNQIKKLIESLTKNDNQRKKIIDVRNWLSFSAIEKYRADNEQKQYYEDSKGLSDGEKTKLAYTILASALAYQFNIQLNETKQKSFRFVVIDEAFGKIDPANAEYAMRLFENLKLQVMIVTPLDKINIVENYVKHYAYVEKKENNRSKVFNLDEQEYKTLKEKHKDEIAE